MDSSLSAWLAPGIALSSAAFFGILVHLHRRGLDTTDGATGSLVNAAALAGMFWITAPFWIDLRWFLTPGALIFAGLGLLFPIGSLRLTMLSVPRLGSVLTDALGSFTSFFAVIPAILLFDERVGAQGWAGLVLTTLALLLATAGGGSIRRDWPFWAILLPLGAAAIRGGMQPGLKVALNSAPSAAFGVMLMATVSTLVMLAMRGAARQPIARPTRGWLWFILAGMAQGTALFLLTSALRVGEVLVVSALSATAPLWTLLYGAVIFRREVLGARHLWVVLLTVVGGALIVTR